MLRSNLFQYTCYALLAGVTAFFDCSLSDLLQTDTADRGRLDFKSLVEHLGTLAT